MLLILEELARLVVATEPLTAVRLAGASEAHRVALGIKRRPAEDERFRLALARAREVCATGSFEQAWADGSCLTPAQTNLEALELTARLAALAPDQPTSSAEPQANSHG